MSRLDDELQKAFKREQPSADFMARVLDRIAEQPSSSPRWWQRLAMLLEPPTLRWVAIGVIASVLLAIGAAQYVKMSNVLVVENQTVGIVEPVPDDINRNASNPDKVQQVAAASKPLQSNKRIDSYSPSHQPMLARRQKERELMKEAEAAKEKLMLALSIASTALNDAQKAVHDDRPNP